MYKATLPYEEPVKMFDNQSPTEELEREPDNSLESEHEYEIPGIIYYNLTSDKVKVPPPKSKSTELQSLSTAGDYEFTQYSAYVATATTCIHGRQH